MDLLCFCNRKNPVLSQWPEPPGYGNYCLALWSLCGPTFCHLKKSIQFPEPVICFTTLLANSSFLFYLWLHYHNYFSEKKQSKVYVLNTRMLPFIIPMTWLAKSLKLLFIHLFEYLFIQLLIIGVHSLPRLSWGSLNMVPETVNLHYRLIPFYWEYFYIFWYFFIAYVNIF